MRETGTDTPVCAKNPGFYFVSCLQVGHMKRIANALVGFFLAAYVCAPAYAFTPIQAPILSAAAVTPNVMFLLDNSGSMRNAVLPPDAVPGDAVYYSVRECNRWGQCFIRWVGGNLAQANIPLSQMYRGNCSSGYKSLASSSAGADERCYKFPDPVGDSETWFSAAYLSYVYKTYDESPVDLTTSKSPTDPTLKVPNEYRMKVAKDVISNLVSANRGLRYGLFSFNPNSTGAGGSLRADIKDFSKTMLPNGTVVVTDAQAQTNYNNFLAAVNVLEPKTSTPLAEAYYEITRYYRGLGRYQGSGSGNYTSPIQYRCQRNFGIVVTDGLPTFDRTFPTDDPQRTASSGAGSLPDWDGTKGKVDSNGANTVPNNDGPNIGGDEEGDALYLDDIAKFAYDVDLKDTSALDGAKKSFNAPGFLKQNLLTYTVGFAVDNQMLADAATYGRGRYYTASDSKQLNDSLTRAINEISAKAGSGGAGASSSATLTTATYYYKTLYDPKDWRGTIEAYLLNPATGRPISNVPDWSTDNTITPSSNGATYQTFNDGAGAGSGVVALDYNNLTATQKETLDKSVAAPVTGADLIAWVKGKNDNPNLRTPANPNTDDDVSRRVLLGDVINSSLERLSPDEILAANLSGDSTYSDYLALKSKMTSSLLVNSNDGLFHVIDATTGAHRYAFMPSALLSALHLIAAPDYASSGSHNFMVDGPIKVADAQLGSDWATVAIGGMGAGGKSLFAIKLYDKSGNNINALWEIKAPVSNTPGNDWNDLGYTYSKAAVVRTQSGNWVAIFGNGYGSHEGKAALYVVNLSDGKLLQKIVVDDNTTGTTAQRAAGSGLSSPQVVVDAQGRMLKAYAGDLRGNLWEFDSNFSASKLFVTDAGQPITAQPLVVDHPTKDGHLVLVGTGKLNEAVDKLDKTLQSFYAIWDSSTNDSAVAKSSLVAQAFTGEVTINGESYLESSSNTVDWSVSKGWYLPLILGSAAQGERVIYQAQATLGRVIFVTAKVDAADPCESTGSGRLVELDVGSGSKLSYPVLDTNGDGKVDDKDSIVSGLNINDGLPGSPVIIDSGSSKASQTKIILLSTGVTKTVDEFDPNPPCQGEKCDEEEAGEFSKRIMWRQLQ